MEAGVPVVADLEGLLDADRALGLAALDAELHAIEDLERVLAARRARALGLAERYRLHTADSHASMWGYLRADLGWSTAECRRRMRLARLVAEHEAVADRLGEGVVPVAAVEEIARAHANPRCGDQLGGVLGELLNAAERVEHDDMRALVDRWLTLADTDGAHRQAELSHARRNAHVDVFAGVGSIHANFGALDGAELLEIFEHFYDAELRTDWKAAEVRHGDQASKSQLARTDAQRRADTIVAIFRAAASAPPVGAASTPVVNVMIDLATLADHLVELEMLPTGFTDTWPELLLAQRRCETSTGIAVTPHDAFQLAMAGHIRRLVVDEHGQVIQAGTLQRLFRGAARKVVMVQHPRCTHRGCRARAGRCQADHLSQRPDRPRQRRHRVPPPQPRPVRARLHRTPRSPRLAHLSPGRHRGRQRASRLHVIGSVGSRP